MTIWCLSVPKPMFLPLDIPRETTRTVRYTVEFLPTWHCPRILTMFLKITPLLTPASIWSFSSHSKVVISCARHHISNSHCCCFFLQPEIWDRTFFKPNLLHWVIALKPLFPTKWCQPWKIVITYMCIVNYKMLLNSWSFHWSQQRSEVDRVNIILIQWETLNFRYKT